MREDLTFLLERAKAFPFLTREEEVKVFAQMRGRNAKVAERARERLVMSNQRIVASEVMKWRAVSAPAADLMQEGNLGLLHAIKNFEPKKGNRFNTYAVWWVRAYITRFLGAAIGVSVVNRSAENRLRARQSGRYLTFSEPDWSLNAPVSDDGEEDWQDRLEDQGPAPEERFAHAQRLALVRGEVDKIRARSSSIAEDVITLRLSAETPMTLKEIADRHGVSREWVRLVEKNDVIPRLRRQLAAFDEDEAA